MHSKTLNLDPCHSQNCPSPYCFSEMQILGPVCQPQPIHKDPPGGLVHLKFEEGAAPDRNLSLTFFHPSWIVFYESMKIKCK